MKKWPAVCVLGLTTLQNAPGLTAGETATLGKVVSDLFDVADGLDVTVWAESPQFFNPTNIDIDRRGRIWVTEAVNYRNDKRRSRPGDGYLRHEKGDRIVILEDTDGDGVADSSKVFAEDPDLVAPLGIAVLGNQVVVSCSPNVLVFTDTDGDDKADKKEVFLTGFDGKDHDHGVHAVTAGPDGRWYFNAGNHGPHIVKDRAGWTMRTTNEGAGRLAQKSDDGHQWIQGVVLRINPDGTGLRVLADNFRNGYETALDAFGNMWQNVNDDDGNRACEMTQVVEGGSYGFVSLNGTRAWTVDRREGQTAQTAHWHQDDPGTTPPTEITGAGAPTGLVVYEGNLLPPRFRGMILNADAGRSTVFGHVPRAVGAGFVTDRINFLATKASGGDEARRFRPSDVAVGTDGAVYVADWYDPVVGGHGMRDKTGYGRIFRVAPRRKAGAPKLVPPTIDVTTVDGAIAALLNPAVNVRYLGLQALRGFGDAAVPTLTKRLGSKEAPVRARLTWALGAGGAAGQKQVVRALKDRDANVRMTAYRALRAGDAQDPKSILPYARLLVHDPSAAVRREIAVSLRDVPWADSDKLLVALAASYDGKDRALLEALGTGADGKEEALYQEIAPKLGHPDPLKWTPAFAGLAWRLHPPAATAPLRKRAVAASLSTDARQKALVALAFTRTADAADAVLAVAEKKDDPLKAYALDLAFDRASSEWKDFGVADRIERMQVKVARTAEDDRMDALKASVLGEAATADERAKAIGSLSESKDGGMFLVGLASQRKLSPEIKDTIAESIFRNPDVGVRALASRYFKRPALDGVEFPPVPELLKMTGDPQRGRKVFFSEVASCSKCHEYGGQGRSVGPSLSEIAAKLGRDALFDSILNPSAAIAFGYEAWVFTTKDQQTYTGFLLGDGDTVFLKDISGESRLIPAKDITYRGRERSSIMPDNIALGMKPQELVDLVAFLASRPATAKR